MNATWAALFGLAGTLAGALAIYLTAIRKLSGRISTSEATDLWKESKAMRDDYREQLTAAEARTAALEARIVKLEARNSGLVQENVELREKVRGDQLVIAGLERRVDEQDATIAALHKRVADMQTELERST